MKISPFRHPVAILRVKILNQRQKEFAGLVGRSSRTIQAIELGTLPLSRELALTISNQTGVSTAWLLDGDPESKPLARNNRQSFTKEIFEKHRAEMEIDASTTDEIGDYYMTFEFIREIFSILVKAETQKRGQLALYKIQKFTEEMTKEFGMDDNANETFKRKFRLLEEIEDVFSASEHANVRKAFFEEYKRHVQNIEAHAEDGIGIFPLLHSIKNFVEEEKIEAQKD